MTRSTEGPGLEALLAHRAWLRRLAAHLLGGKDGAEDAAQETVLAALRTPPSRGDGARPWLAQVLRNVVRRGGRDHDRRRARERAYAELGATTAEPASDSLELLETQRLLTELVATLEEPYRTTLVQRYFEDRTAAEIARAEGVPEGTVRWRTKEGLTRLRQRLAERHGGDERAWRGALIGMGAVPLRGASACVRMAIIALPGVVALGLFLIARGLAPPGTLGAGDGLREGRGAPPPPLLSTAAAPSGDEVRGPGRAPLVLLPRILNLIRIADATWRPLASDDLPTRGDPSAPIMVFAVVDLSTPIVAEALSTIDKIVQAYPEDLRLVVRPVAQWPATALLAEAVMAAHERGKFWPFIERVKTDLEHLDEDSLASHARAIGLDGPAFREALLDRRFKPFVDRSTRMVREASTVLAVGATFLIDGQLLPGVPLESTLKAAVDDVLDRRRGGLLTDRLVLSPQVLQPGPLLWPPPRVGLSEKALGSPVALPPTPPDAPVRGNPHALLEVLYFDNLVGTRDTNDAGRMLDGLLRTHGHLIRLVARPLARRSPDGLRAVEALWAAHEQGTFWDLHDGLRAQGPPFTRPVLERLAAEAGLNLAAFRAALDDRRFAARVERDTAAHAGVRFEQWPAFVIDGVVARGPSAVWALLESALRRKGVRPPQTDVPPAVDPNAPLQDFRRLAPHVSLGQLHDSEARDPVWAPAMEAALGPRMQAELTTLFPQLTSVRLDCRTTTCEVTWAPATGSTVARVLVALYPAPAGRFSQDTAALLLLRTPEESTVEHMLERLFARRRRTLEALREGRRAGDLSLRDEGVPPLQRWPRE